MKKSILNKIINVAEANDWTVRIDNNDFEFQKYSPAGQDFNFSVTAETPEELAEEINERYNNFDCSEEAYLWLNEFGHGRNGAPYDMKDVYEDMEACEEMIRELAVEIQNIL